jgi:hypothetical protein
VSPDDVLQRVLAVVFEPASDHVGRVATAA